jgi:hypothetical protein
MPDGFVFNYSGLPGFTGKFTTPERALEELITWSKTEKKLALTELLYQFAVKYFKACL